MAKHLLLLVVLTKVMWSYAKSGTFANIKHSNEPNHTPDATGHPTLVRVLTAFSRWDGALVAAAGAVVLLGWLIGSEPLKRVAPGLVAMNPLTAVCFIAAGASLGCLWGGEKRLGPLESRLGRILASVLILAGLIKLLDYAFGWELGIDRLLFRQRLDADGSLPNRMAPNTALNFALSGLVLFALNASGRPRSRMAQNVSLIVLFHSLLALLGYVYGANYLYGVGSYIPMALHTAALFLMLSLGLLFAQTDYGAVALFVSNTLGGVIARRLLPFAFGIPALLGALRLWGEKRGLYNSELGVTVMVLVSIVAFTGLIWWNAVLLNRADNQRRKAEADLRQAHDELERRVEDRTAELLKLNESLRAEIAERKKAELEVQAQQEQRRTLEEQFLRSQRMESLGALAGGIAHDLNNALVPVLIGSQLLRERNGDESQRQKILDLITTSAQRCTEMVKQIVTFARGSREKSARVTLVKLIAEMEKIARDTFPKSISIQTRAMNNLWDVEGAASELHQVLMNLCVNARDAMPKGGALTLSAQNVELTADLAEALAGTSAGPHVALSVADTGAGIPPHVIGRIFEPFFTTKLPEHGTGLGLSTVASIVKRHHGAIEVKSLPGKGTEFKIFLPAIKTPALAEDKEKSRRFPVGRHELILVVDDEQLVVELVKSTLENYGYRVLTAPNGLEAVACFETHKNEIRLLLTDTDMPYLNGMSVIRAVQKIDPGLPVVLASGTELNTEFLSSQTQILRLPKPYDVEQLLESVARALLMRKAVVKA